MIVVPAYGRDYKTAKAAKEAWAAGKDFQICDMSSRWDGAYVNAEDAKRGGEKNITIRFCGLTKTCVINN